MPNRTDTFDRADSAVTMNSPSDGGSDWVIPGGTTWGIASNRGYAVSGALGDVACLESSLADVDVQVTISTLSTNGGLAYRVVDIQNYFLATVRSSGGSALELYRYEASVFNSLGSFSYTPANGDVLKVVASGNGHSVYVNGVLRIGPVTDSFQNTATKHGLWTYNTTATRWDDFSITDNAGGGGGNRRRRVIVCGGR